MYQPVILEKEYHIVARDSLLFVFCAGPCGRQLTWVPTGGGRFHSNCCGYIYHAEPMDIDMHNYSVKSEKWQPPTHNVLTFAPKKKPATMRFA